MLDSPRRIMRKDLQLKLNTDTGGERSKVKARQNLAIFPRVLAMIVASQNIIHLMYGPEGNS